MRQLPGTQVRLRRGTGNQQIQSWALYHRHDSRKRTYSEVDNAIFWQLWRWARRRHRKKSATWIRKEYYRVHEGRTWVFTGTCYTQKGKPFTVRLLKAADVRIQRHNTIQAKAHPYEPAWESYYEARLQEKLNLTLAGRERLRFLWEEQQGRCPVCGQLLTEESDWQVHPIRWRVYGGGEQLKNLPLLHANCHRQIHHVSKMVESSCTSREVLAKA